MEYPLSLLGRESEISFDTEEDAEKKTDLFQTKLPTWSTKYQRLEAYCCFVLSYLSTLKFCLTVGKYGFAVLIPYWVYNILIGFAAVLVEIQMGRYCLGNVATAFAMCPISTGILYCAYATTTFAIMYDHLSNAYLLKYFFSSFRKSLPWETCDPEWAGINCFVYSKKEAAIANCTKRYSKAFCNNLTWESSGRQYWERRVISTDSFSFGYSVFCISISVFLSFIIVYKGIRGVEKLFPIFVYSTLIIWLLVACITFLIPGAFGGFYSLWQVDLKLLFEPEAWLDGLRDTIYILGLGKLTLSFISSHGRFDDNILMDVVMASIGGLFSCVLITTPILSVIVSMRFNESLNIDNSEGIFKDIFEVFIFMSEAMLAYPNPRPLWSILTYLTWFLMSTSAQALSVLAICEAINGLSSSNLFYWISSLLAIGSFCTGIALTFYPVFLLLNLGTTTVVVVLLNTIIWQHCYGIWKFNKDYYFMMGRPLPILVRASWVTLPIMTTINLTLQLVLLFPDKPFKYVTVFYIGFPIALFLIVMLLTIVNFALTKRKISAIFRPNPLWGPQNPILKKSRTVFDSNTASTEMLYRQELCNRPFIKPPEFVDQNIVHLI